MKRIAIAALVTAAAFSSAANACDLSMKDYAAIKTGMTIEEASKAINCEGEEASRMNAGTLEIITYKWNGRDVATAIISSFQNGRLTYKMQMGLPK